MDPQQQRNPTLEGEQLPTVGIDLGGTHFRVGWLGASRDIEDVQVHPTLGHRHVNEVVTDIAREIHRVRNAAHSAGRQVAAVGIGVPAVVEPHSGRVLLAPNLSRTWLQFPLGSALSELAGLPVYVLNDARSYILAEARLGAARDVANVLGITLGTGVGGGLVLDGQLRLGPHCLAGEFGHMTCDPSGPPCGCGGIGCVESYASGTAIAAAALGPLLQGRAPQLRDLLGGNTSALDAQAVANAALQGDVECAEIFVRAGKAVGVAIANVMKLVDIERVVVGGGVAAAAWLMFDPIRTAMRRHCAVFGGCEPEIVAGGVKQPGVIGAALWAREQMTFGQQHKAQR